MYEIKSREQCNRRHKEFQFGTNPMEMTPFEKAQIAKEKMDRYEAKEHYIFGIQGVDGGKMVYESEEHE